MSVLSYVAFYRKFLKHNIQSPHHKDLTWHGIKFIELKISKSKLTNAGQSAITATSSANSSIVCCFPGDLTSRPLHSIIVPTVYDLNKQSDEANDDCRVTIHIVVASITIPLARRAAVMKDCRVYCVQSIYSAIVYITMQIIIT